LHLVSRSPFRVAIQEILIDTMRSQLGPGHALSGIGVNTSPAIDGPGRFRFLWRKNFDMAQIFHRSANLIARFSVLGLVVLANLALGVVLLVARSPYITNERVTREQPVQFSHKHHVGDDGIDCRYCHNSVETSAYAGIPPTKTCMNCHSVLFNDSPYLEPIRESYRSDQSIEWVKVHRLADYVYFNHSIHINKGIGCSSCHGPVNDMPLMFQASPLNMQWCLDCHRDPAKNIRPRDQVFNMQWKAPANQEELGRKLVAEYKIRTVSELTSCSTCHR